MNRIIGWILASLLMLPLVATAQVNSLPSQPHLLVKGQAKREVMPDRFSLIIKLRAVGLQPEAARKRVQASAEQILTALKRYHVLKDSLEASSLQIQPSYTYSQQGVRDFEGTEVKRSIGGSFQSLDDVRQFLGEMKTSSEIELSGITTSYSKESQLRAQLKREAAEQSRASAAELAKAYGVSIQGLYTISDVAPNFAYGIQAGDWPTQVSLVSGSPASPAPAADVAAVVDSLEAGTVTISENIYAVFLIAQ
ncbi:hypothetical protein ASF73_10795 [Xanthomonas sp. Leaf131]|nr:hypothetical protein ASF73_10795 [Xanthomonas sp. Leaf131]